MEFNSPSTVNLVCLNIYNTVQLKIETSIYCVGGAPTRKSAAAAAAARRCPKIGGGGAIKKSAAAARGLYFQKVLVIYFDAILHLHFLLACFRVIQFYGISEPRPEWSLRHECWEVTLPVHHLLLPAAERWHHWRRQLTLIGSRLRAFQWA